MAMFRLAVSLVNCIHYCIGVTHRHGWSWCGLKVSVFERNVAGKLSNAIHVFGIGYIQSSIFLSFLGFKKKATSNENKLGHQLDLLMLYNCFDFHSADAGTIAYVNLFGHIWIKWVLLC